MWLQSLTRDLAVICGLDLARGVREQTTATDSLRATSMLLLLLLSVVTGRVESDQSARTFLTIKREN